MSIDTAEQTLRWLGACHGEDDQIHCLQQWRQQIAEDVLSTVRKRLSLMSCHVETLYSIRSEYAAPQRPAVDVSVATSVARRAKIEVFQDMRTEIRNIGNGASSIKAADRFMVNEEVMMSVADRHGIQPHELEPVKLYTVENIKAVEELPGYINGWAVFCKDVRWCTSDWAQTKRVNIQARYSKHDAEVIAAHLRATGNVPEGAT